MGSYYYLAAQLPYLVYGQGVPMSSADFKAMAHDAMSSADAALLDCCTLDPDPEAGPGVSYAEQARRTGSDFINRWKEWERTLRLTLARGRFQKLKREGGVMVDPPEYPADAAAVAKNALAMESPLEAEFFLDKARWDAIESFQDISNFTENAMYAYLLKLQLMERRSAFKNEEGLAEYKGLYDAILSLETQVLKTQV